MILNDREIKELCQKEGMIQPFVPNQVREVQNKPVISYGLSSFGYDIRLSDKYKMFLNPLRRLIDPKDFASFDKDCGLDVSGKDGCVVLPNSFVLGLSLEEFNLPRNVMGICVGKSTYARCGVLVNVTPLEPCWKGRLVIEIGNTTPFPVKIYSGEGIAQIIFFRGNDVEVSYADKNGKYQSQTDIQVKV